MSLKRASLVGMPKHQHMHFTPYAIVGVLIILSILYFAGSPRTPSLNDTNPIDVATNSAQPSGSVSPLESAAAKNFFFTLSQPRSGATVTTKQITFTGKTVAGADVFINEMDATADGGGNFSVSYTLEEGQNYFLTGANDEYGNIVEKEITVTYAP